MKYPQLLLCLLAGASLSAETPPLLPFVDNVRTRYQPSGDGAWMLTGKQEVESKITAAEISADGRTFFMGDDDGFVSALDVGSQKILWRTEVIEGGEAVSSLRADRTGTKILAAKTRGVNEFSHTYLIQAAGHTPQVKDLGEEPAFSRECEATRMDPIDFAWSSDSKSYVVLYQTHALANRDGCQVAEEVYLAKKDLNGKRLGLKKIGLQAFSKPERDEPDEIFCMGVVRMAQNRAGSLVAVSFCNSRVLTYRTDGQFTFAGMTSSVQYALEDAGASPASGAGHMAFDRAGSIYFGMGQPGAMAKSSIVKISKDLTKMELLANVHMPYPKISLDDSGRFLMAGSNIVFLYDLQERSLLFWGPLGSWNGQAAALHPGKRLIFLPEERGRVLQTITERPGLRLRVGTDWTSTGKIVRGGDSVYVAGKGRIGLGFGEWLREDWKYGDSWIDQYIDDVPPNLRGKPAEFKIRAKEPGEYMIYGGRSEAESDDAGLVEALRGW
jgi:hypothetical protein